MVLLYCRPPNKKFEDKVFIPQENHPETNFVGLLIGPRYICNLLCASVYLTIIILFIVYRGHTLKQLERDVRKT